ncbi:MAG: pirin family protein [Butyricimonas faecalis]
MKGDLEHQDSLKHKDTIKEGEIQVMSAGTGIMQVNTIEMTIGLVNSANLGILEQAKRSATV